MLCVYMFFSALFSLLVDFILRHIRHHFSYRVRDMLDMLDFVFVILGMVFATGAFYLYVSSNGSM
jgi:hypothetical protein